MDRANKKRAEDVLQTGATQQLRGPAFCQLLSIFRCFFVVLLPIIWLAMPGIKAAYSQYSQADSLVTRSFRGSDVIVVDTTLQIAHENVFGQAVSELSCKAPLKADREFVLVFYSASYGSNGNDRFSYRVRVKMDEGQKKLTVKIPFLVTHTQMSWDVELYENGRNMEDKRVSSQQSPYQYFYLEPSNLLLAGLATQSETDSGSLLKRLTDAAGGDAANTNLNRNATFNQSASQRCTVASVNDASSDWRIYSAYSSWSMSAKALNQLNKNPQVAEAVRNYIGSGGYLFIFGLRQEDFKQIDRLLYNDLPPAQAARWVSLMTPKKQWWLLRNNTSTPYTQNSGLDGSLHAGLSGLDNSAETGEDDGDTESEPAQVQGKRGRASSVESLEGPGSLTLSGLTHDLAVLADTWLETSITGHTGLLDEVGKIFSADSSISATFDDHRSKLMDELRSEKILGREFLFGHVYVTSQPLAQLPADLWQNAIFRKSSGISDGEDGNWFWKNFVLTVGKPPVWIFCGIVGLFGMLLGPGLLYLTGRIGRRSMMLFLVPAVSLVVTLGIIGYGITYEGFETHLRISSVQRIDSAAKKGFVWSRQTYFSGLPPRDGLKFEAQTYIRQVHPSDSWSSGRYYEMNPRKNLAGQFTIGENDQQLTNWLKPRQQQQLMVGHPVASPQIPIGLTRVRLNTVAIENKTPDDLPVVLLRGAGDDYYLVHELPAGQTVQAEAVNNGEALAEVAKLMVDYRPTVPPEIGDGGSLMNFGRSFTPNVYDTADIINEALQLRLSDKFEMQPFSFSVLAKHSDMVEVPLTGIASDNLHLIVGDLTW